MLTGWRHSRLYWTTERKADDAAWHHCWIILVPPSPGRVTVSWPLTTKPACRVPAGRRSLAAPLVASAPRSWRKRIQHRLTTDKQGSLLHLAANQPQKLSCYCPNCWKITVQWPTGIHKRVLPTAIISYRIRACGPTEHVAAEGSRIKFDFICI